MHRAHHNGVRVAPLEHSGVIKVLGVAGRTALLRNIQHTRRAKDHIEHGGDVCVAGCRVFGYGVCVYNVKTGNPNKNIVSFEVLSLFPHTRRPTDC